MSKTKLYTIFTNYIDNHIIHNIDTKSYASYNFSKNIIILHKFHFAYEIRAFKVNKNK